MVIRYEMKRENLENLEIYKIVRELNRDVWDIYKELKNEFKFSIGQQFLRSIDSIGANIAEGFGKYHYLDSVKFYYNTRGSLWESKYWLSLLNERSQISNEKYKIMRENLDKLGVKLNNFITNIKIRVQNNK